MIYGYPNRMMVGTPFYGSPLFFSYFSKCLRPFRNTRRMRRRLRRRIGRRLGRYGYFV